MRRIMMLMTVVVLIMVMLATTGAPTFARVKCENTLSTTVCTGGEGGRGGTVGPAGYYNADYQSGDVFLAVGDGGKGGGYGRKCEGNLFDVTEVCHGTAYTGGP
jgi:hypothetical protein